MEQSVYMSVKRTRQGQKETLFAIYRTSRRADYTETLGHGSIQQLQACSANANVAFLAASAIKHKCILKNCFIVFIWLSH